MPSSVASHRSPTRWSRGINSGHTEPSEGHNPEGGVPNVAKACEKVRSLGGKVTREPGPVKGGTSVIAFVEDPDGYKIEFIESRR